MKKAVYLVAAVEFKARVNASGHVLGLFVETGDAHLNVNYWLRRETRDRRRANVVDSQCRWSQALDQPIAPLYEGASPAEVILHDFDLITHAHGGHLLKTGPDHRERTRGKSLTFGEWQFLGCHTARVGDEVVEVHQIYALPLAFSAPTPLLE
jgi:hypothetical protein